MQIAEDFIPFKCEFVDDISQVNESAQSEVANSNGTILAIVKGKHFVPGGVSRNRRKYTEELWQAAGKDEEVQRKVKNNQMIGRVGHDAEITDEDLGEGRYSHYTRNINWETGEAEDVILNTPMGNSLYTLLRSGVVMYVSSRADGDYNGKDEDGNDILDPKTYKLERFDFVQDPGFLDAHPKMITESKQEKDESIEIAVAESLLKTAKEIGAELELDGNTYMVESVEKDAVIMSDCTSGSSDNYKLEDFTEVTEDIRRSIVLHCESLSKEIKESHELVKTLRFANKQGLNEDFVEKRRKAGATFESIEKEYSTPQTFKVVETKINKKDDDSFLTRLFG